MTPQIEYQIITRKTSIPLDYDEYHHMTNLTEDQIVFIDKLMWYLDYYIFILLCGRVSIFRTLSKAVNMTIFFKLELKDSMPVCLFALSFTDFLISGIVMLAKVFPVLKIVCDIQGIGPTDLLYVGPEWNADALFLSSD